MGDFDRPFVGSLAVACGQLSTRQLRVDFERVFRDVYIRKGVRLDARAKADAAALWAADDGIVAGLSAVSVHGSLWIDDDEPAEVFRTGSRRTPSGLIVHGDALTPDEFGVVDSLLVSTPTRTAYDLGRRPPIERAVGRLDALCRATGLKPADVLELAERHRGVRGIVQLRAALALVDPGAESPKETETRLVLIDGGLPAPSTQIAIHDERGRIVARADLGWERWKVIVEYDGTQHWTDERQRTWDLERTSIVERLGWREVRVNSEMLRTRPRTIVQRARAKLRQAGAPV